MSECIFCKIIKKELPSYKIWEDEDFYAFLDINPVRAGHMLVIPKKHEDYIFDLDDQLYTKLFHTVKKLSHSLRRATEAKKIGIAVEGISVPHVHIHLIPVNSVNDLDPCLSERASNEELEKTKGKITKYIK